MSHVPLTLIVVDPPRTVPVVMVKSLSIVGSSPNDQLLPVPLKIRL